MDEREEANAVIGKMNELWALLNTPITARLERTTRNEFVKCQQWLSKRNMAYHQEQTTGKWKLTGEQA
jgi:hypothetical protein